jgi:hypothetical protein
VEDARADTFKIAGDEAAGLLVQDDEARTIRAPDALVRVVHAVARVDVQEIAIDQHGTVRPVVRPGPRLPRSVEQPDDVGVDRRDVERACFIVRILRDESRAAGDQRRATIGCHVPAFVLVRPIVAVGLAFDVEADHLAAIGDEVDAVALYSRRRAHARPGPVQVHVGSKLRADQLPQEVAVLLIEAQQHRPIALVARVTRRVVVRPDEHPALGDHRGGPRLTTQRYDPPDVLARAGIEAIHQAGLGRDHVACEGLTPLGLVASPSGRQQERDAKEYYGSTKHEIRNPKRIQNSKHERPKR